jgi:hypothetical protein
MTSRQQASMELRAGDNDQMRTEILRFVPIGTPADQATAVMQSQGFHVAIGNSHNHLDGELAFCTTVRDSLFSLVDCHVTITMTCEGGNIVAVKVEHVLVGP